MNERPILFSCPMVRAILEGRKTQTRRVMSYQPEHTSTIYGPERYHPVVVDAHGEEEPGDEIFGVYGEDWGLKCPYGQPGDRLWVRETFADSEPLIYRATLPPGMKDGDCVWKPSIYMPRIYSRITLEIVNVRVERLQQITRDDAKAEGVSNRWDWNAQRNEQHPEHFVRSVLNPYIANYSVLWDEINTKRGYGWDVNPWVWVIEFKKVEVDHVGN